MYKHKAKRPYVLMALKYAFALLLALADVLLRAAPAGLLLAVFTEVLAIALVTNLLCGINRRLGYAVNALTLALVNIQLAVFYWAGTFVSLVMLTNLESVEALSGKALAYGLTAVVVFFFSLLPVRSIKPGRRGYSAAGGALLLSGGLLLALGLGGSTPYHALWDLCQQQRSRARTAAMVAEVTGGENPFLCPDVTDHYPKPAGLVARPNVILLFAEGLSQSILEDERSVMPHLCALEERSVRFSNYFNHTFATYMGLSGQLHSGYQQNNTDPNYLVSLQDVFKLYGYRTAFINTEPRNGEFTAFLEAFDFDSLETNRARLDGEADSMSDKAAYELLLETALELDAGTQPFFLSMYSFGTHVTFDGVHERFGDGSLPLLNRFYDLDVQLGTFLEAFEASALAKNTLLIFTADHATYADADFYAAYPQTQRAASTLDRIPLMFYYPGAEPAVYDVRGRNSLDLAPTVLDFLDMSAENCFLGESLFAPAEQRSPWDTFFESVGTCCSSRDGTVRSLTIEETQAFERLLASYYAAKAAENAAESAEEPPRLYAQVDQSAACIQTELLHAGDRELLLYAVWSEEDGQDDLLWHPAQGGEEPLRFSIDLSAHEGDGLYHIHVYAQEEEELVFVAAGTVVVTR